MSRLKVAIVPMLLTEDRSLYQATYQRFMVPLGPIALASYLESLDLPLEILVHDHIETILRFKPDVVGLSSVSENFGYAQQVARLLKEKANPFILVGGPHFTSLPEFLPECFDLGVVGEGEKTFEQVLRILLSEGHSKKHFMNIPGVVFKDDGKTIATGKAPQVQNLDALPLPDRKRWVNAQGVPHIMTTRGCVYRCFFCAEPSIFKGFRQASPARILREVEFLSEQFPAVSHIRFYDDIFPVNKKRLRELCQLFEERGINKRFSFSCFIHARLVDEEVADLLKRMNFIYVQFGAETGSPQLIKQIKPEASVDLNQKTIDLFWRKGIRVGLTLIVGTPEETEGDLQRTHEFIKKNRRKLLDVEISPAVALPGTSLWDHARKKGVIPALEKMDWDAFRDYAHLKDFNLERYIYLAEQIRPAVFVSALKKMEGLIEKIHSMNQTEQFLLENYLAGYMPVAFHTPGAANLIEKSPLSEAFFKSDRTRLGGYDDKAVER